MSNSLNLSLTLTHKERCNAEQIAVIKRIFNKGRVSLVPFREGYSIYYPDGYGEFMLIRGVIKTATLMNEELFDGETRSKNLAILNSIAA